MFKRNISKWLMVSIITAVLLVGAFGIRVYLNIVTEEAPPIQQQVHVYKNPAQGIESIQARLFYVNSDGSFSGDWEEVETLMIDDLMPTVSRFHLIQFLGKSRIQFRLYPEVLHVGLSGEDVDKFTTIQEQLAGRIKGPTIEKLEEFAIAQEFLQVRPTEYLLRIYIVEGRSMGVAPGIVLLGREVIEDEAYISIRESMLYHQIGHALGMPHMHAADNEGESRVSEGIMGLGRFRPLETNFIDDQILLKMGILQ